MSQFLNYYLDIQYYMENEDKDYPYKHYINQEISLPLFIAAQAYETMINYGYFPPSWEKVQTQSIKG